MDSTEVLKIIKQELPSLIAEDSLVRDFVLKTVSEYYAPKQETDSKFERILAQLERDREEQARKWDQNDRRWHENLQEQARKWDEQARKWDESTKRFEQMQLKIDQQGERIDQALAEIKAMNKKYDSTIGALGSRWGLYSEASFRNALKGILEQSFGVQVLNINDFDDLGEVFGRPDQVEIDVIIKNGLVILCEIKSNISKSEMYTFNRKVEFYQKRHQREVNRKLVISPMVDKNALPVAENLEIEVFSYAEDVSNL